MSFAQLLRRSLATVPTRVRPYHPAVPEYGPKRLDRLDPGKTFLWCSCGLSRAQPWCDGTHKLTNFKPMRWKVPPKKESTGEGPEVHSICQCKHTSTPPHCDGTHVLLKPKVMDRQSKCACDHDRTNVIRLEDRKCVFCDYCGRVSPM